MIYTIEYSKDADKTLKKWKKSNPQLFKKATRILFDIMEHPRTGLGHPEPLVGGNDVTYSRHISSHDRIIYDIYTMSVSQYWSFRLRTIITTNKLFSIILNNPS